MLKPRWGPSLVVHVEMGSIDVHVMFFQLIFCLVFGSSIPIGSLYGIFTYIYHKKQLNVVYHTWMVSDHFGSYTTLHQFAEWFLRICWCKMPDRYRHVQTIIWCFLVVALDSYLPPFFWSGQCRQYPWTQIYPCLVKYRDLKTPQNKILQDSIVVCFR